MREATRTGDTSKFIDAETSVQQLGTDRHFLRRAVRACVLVALASHSASSIASAQVVRDSASVRVISYAATDGPSSRWRIGEQPTLVIGTEAGPVFSTFSNVTNALHLEDGSIVIGDMDSREIRFFDSRGSYVRSVGREGSGPGEFQSLWRVWRDESRLLAMDGSGRIHAFSIRGDYLDTTGPFLSASGARIRQHGFLADGIAVGSFMEPTTEVPMGESDAAATLVRVAEGGMVPIARFPAYVTIRRPARRPASLVYGPAAAIAVLREGVCVGYPRTYEFRCFDERGALRTITRRDEWPHTPVADSDRELYFAGIDRSNPGERGAAYRNQVRETTTFATEFPAYGRFVAAWDTGELWVGPMVPEDETLGVLNAAPSAPTTWSVFSADGLWLSDVVLPARFHLMDAGSDYVLGVTRDDTDVERVVMYRLHRS